MHFVEFPESIPESERIYNLPELLKDEWPGILQWAIEGCLEWQKIGLQRPESVKAATMDYLGDEDTLGRWIEDCCTVSQSLKVGASEAYNSYKSYVEKAGEGVVSQKRFSQRMEARGFQRYKTSTTRYFLGIDIVKIGGMEWKYGNDKF
jgi:phage/plasmid-associated DNA primase